MGMTVTKKRNPYLHLSPMGHFSTHELLHFLTIKERRRYWFSRQLGIFRRRRAEDKRAAQVAARSALKEK